MPSQMPPIPGPDAPASAGSPRDRIYESIYRKISLGEWPNGTKLPAEAQLAAEFGVSRLVLREALTRLRIDGLVESRQGAGTRVIASPSRAVLPLVEKDGLAELVSLYEMRVGVEGEVAYLAAKRATPRRIAAIEAAHQKMRKALTQPGAEVVEEDIAFHLAVARATENSYYLGVVESAVGGIRTGISIARSLEHRTNEERVENTVTEHGQLLDVIRSGDADRARQMMRDHIENARARLFLGR
ncbi:FadR/GntR family transcriptional regulator [Salipiger sp. PrR007]|uniref:FadR/GntR family transcriptional regulator n=1 Tax=Salipiger sp. PrR007 TaxID=2706884 RepID=UPI0013BC78A3|nr:FadR/GntR family transcriptional regulator [Salipiger sp. PrR007]NDW33419.1 FadR family transcriptional regulator [Salipiger sp. PrR007]